MANDAIHDNFKQTIGKVIAKIKQKFADKESFNFLDEFVLGESNFSYDTGGGVIVPVYQKADGTYYYLSNGSEVIVNESDLEKDEDNNVAIQRTGGFSSEVNEEFNRIANQMAQMKTQLDDYEVVQENITTIINEPSLISRKNARIINEDNTIALTNDTTTISLGDIGYYIKLNNDSIEIYTGNTLVATFAKEADGTPYFQVSEEGPLKATDANLTTINMVSNNNVGSLCFTTSSNGHIIIRGA